MKTIGIIGGLGPLATSDLFAKIVRLTDAKSDQEHIHVLIDDNPSIPDRTAAILSGGKDPAPMLVETAKRLELMGADFLIMPCNTAHFFYDKIIAGISIPLLNMIDEAADEAVRLGLRRIGLLATDGTHKTRLYEDALEKRGIAPVNPSEKGQEAVMRLIYEGVKAGNMAYDLSDVHAALNEMESGDKLTFMLACTELPVAFSLYGINKPVLDPTTILAKRAIVYAGANVREV